MPSGRTISSVSTESPLSREYDATENDIQIAKNELAKLESQRNKTFDLLEQGIYTEAIFTERNNNIAERIKEVKCVGASAYIV